jgi:hypothetical protein
MSQESIGVDFVKILLLLLKMVVFQKRKFFSDCGERMRTHTRVVVVVPYKNTKKVAFSKMQSK